MKTYKQALFVCIAVFAILMQLANPVPAYADDGQPPVEPTETVTEPPPVDPIQTADELPPPPDETDSTLEESAAPEEAVAEAESASTESVPATEPTLEEQPVPEEALEEEPAPVEEVTEETPTVQETLQDLPADTGVIVVNESGETVPLAAQEAAEIIMEGDPMWCPEGATTVTSACVNAATIGVLLPLLASKDEDGVIYFYTPTTYNTDDVTFNGTNANIAQLADNALTLQGGWDGIASGTINFSGNSIFSVPISITNWTGDVTINNIVVNDASTAPVGGGIYVRTTRNIALDNVTVTRTTTLQGGADGAYLSGVKVSVTESAFFGNQGSGLVVYSAGDVTISDVTASGNGENGIYIQGANNIIATNVTTSGNGRNGVYVYEVDNITATCSDFSSNGGYGIKSERYDVSSPLYIGPANSDLTLNSVGLSGNKSGEYYNGKPAIVNVVECGESEGKDGSVFVRIIVISALDGEAAFVLDCAVAGLYVVNLPNGDKVHIFCPVSGLAIIKRLNNTMLPSDLPAGYNYASAFSLEIIQGTGAIEFIREGGKVKPSFVLPSTEPGTNYSILYWDKGSGKWVTLKEFMFDENGNPVVFDLDENRKIISGLKFDDGEPPRVEVMTNFPGIYVLVRH